MKSINKWRASPVQVGMTANQQVTSFTCAGENNCQSTIFTCAGENECQSTSFTCAGENDIQSTWTVAGRPQRSRVVGCSLTNVVELSTKCWRVSLTSDQLSQQRLPPTPIKHTHTHAHTQSHTDTHRHTQTDTHRHTQTDRHITAASSTYARQTLILLTWHLFPELLQVEPRHLKRVSVDKCPACEKYLCHATDSKNYVKNRLIAEKYHQQASLISCWCANWHHRQGMTALWQENVISLLTFK